MPFSYIMPEVPYSYYPRGDIDWSIGGTPPLKDWEDFRKLIKKYLVNPEDYPEVRKRAEISGELYYAPAFRELSEQADRARREYEYARQNLEPVFQRALGDIGVLRERQLGDVSRAVRSVNEATAQAERRALADLVRRGVARSGLSEYVLSPIRQRGLQQMGEVEREGILGLERLGLRGVETAQERANRLNQLLDTYRNTIEQIEKRRSQLREEQGKRAYVDYQNFMNEMLRNALTARQQSLAERTAWDTMYWNQAKFLEDMRRWGLEYALRLYQLRKIYGDRNFPSPATPPNATPTPAVISGGVPIDLQREFEQAILASLLTTP